jgi:hypothetical protein
LEQLQKALEGKDINELYEEQERRRKEEEDWDCILSLERIRLDAFMHLLWKIKKLESFRMK